VKTTKNPIMFGAPLLSICIPTYNRARALDRLLESIYREARDLPAPIEVCISDNASTDNTQKVISKWKKILPIRSRKNRTNYGFDINMVKVSKLASGSFLWYVGDDDVIAKGALPGFVENLKKAKKMAVRAVFVNYDHEKADTLSSRFAFTELRVFPKSCLAKFPLGINYIGAICVSRKAAMDILDKQTIMRPPMILKRHKNRFHMHDFIHTYIFLECLSKYGLLAIEPQARVVSIEDGSAFTYEWFLYRFIIHMLMMCRALECYPWVKKMLPLDTLQGNIVRAAMAADRPELEGAYGVCQYLAGRFHLLNKDKQSFFTAGKFNALRKNAIFSSCLILFVRLLIMLGWPIKITRKPIVSPEMRKKLEFATLLAECMQTGGRSKLEEFRW